MSNVNRDRVNEILNTENSKHTQYATIKCSKSLTNTEDNQTSIGHENTSHCITNRLISVTTADTENTTKSKTAHLRSDTARFLKIAQLNVVKALASSPSSSQMSTSLPMLNCGRYIRRLDNDRYRILARCHLRSCTLCSQIKGSKYTSLASNAMNQLSHTFRDDTHNDDKTMIGLKITLNTGSACHIDDLKQRLQILHKLWGRMMRTRHLESVLIGAIRSTEVIPERNTLNTANPHIHGLILLPANTDVSELRQVLSIYWRNAMRKAISKLDRKLSKPHMVSQSFQELIELNHHTSSDARQWLTYATKGGYSFDKPDSQALHNGASRQFWIATDTAIKGMRLISACGELKDALKDEKDRRSLLPDQTNSELDSMLITHAWSDTRQDYIPFDEYDSTKDDERWILSRSISYMDAHAHIAPLFKYEEKEHTKREAMVELHKLKSKLITSQDYSTINLIGSLFTIDIKTSDNSRFEPVEVERSKLKSRLAENNKQAQ